MSDHHQPLPTVPSYPFRLDVPLHKLLQESPEKHTPQSSKEKKTLPTPVFPSQPELFHELDADDVAAHDQVLHTGKTALAGVADFQEHARLDGSLFQIARSAWRFSADHRVSFHGVEMQSGLPLLLVLRQSRQGHDRRHRASRH